MVVHGHILANDKKVDIPSYEVNIGDIISLKEKSRNNDLFRDTFLSNTLNNYAYLAKDQDNFSGTLIRYPLREEVPIEINDSLIVEFYSKL
ncbi:small subunit ribosomal protein S4 [Clostridium beijerinckii]|nr:small subunit ribosomal protein S4 [Clostridium beijerinckii]NOV71514.1 small subunit ribosomal protein S4 [Clostridium beijerinckii]NOW32453.1 small subunit ribosomal protein S4 [Clostridium beijerinckii]NOW84825.1 small subunit ribosomal protein S4 [Clostridium beijerinckii]